MASTADYREPHRKPSVTFGNPFLGTASPDERDGSSYFAIPSRSPSAASHYAAPPRRSSTSASLFRPGTSASNMAMALPPQAPLPTALAASAPLYETLHETAAKRIATLQYLRQAHEGQVYWFNTYLFSRPPSDAAHISSGNVKLYTDAKKLQRRAAQYFVLGNSIPGILEFRSAAEFLKAWNVLLQEFETHMNATNGPSAMAVAGMGMVGRMAGGRAHSGSVSTQGGSSGIRAGVSKIFTRSTKTRRGSTATSDGASGITNPVSPEEPPPLPTFPSASTASFPLPGAHHHAPDSSQQYVYLHTPPLPFEVDYFETFATLCDVLVDAYQRLVGLVTSPSVCAAGSGVVEAFMKADGKVKRLVVNGVVKEFEEECRARVKREVGGVAKDVLGGLL